ncbi:hypothetical protein YC2023_024279 [Brassica napus]
MVFPKSSYLIFSSEVSTGHTKQLWTLRVKGTSKPTPEEATRLIENVASSTSAKKTDLERRKMAENSNGDRISEVKETSDLVHAFVIGDEQVWSTDESQTFLREGDEKEHVDLIDETGFRKQRLADQQQNISFTRTYKAEQTHKSKLEYMMGQVLKGQQKMSAVLDEKLDSVYSDLHEKFETLSEHVKKLDSQVAHNAGFVRRDEGFLPGKLTPTQDVKVVLWY